MTLWNAGDAADGGASGEGLAAVAEEASQSGCEGINGGSQRLLERDRAGAAAQPGSSGSGLHLKGAACPAHTGESLSHTGLYTHTQHLKTSALALESSITALQG